MNKIGLVTVLFKSDDVLEGFFKSLSIQVNVAYHLYIIDNSPSAQTAGLIKSLAAQYPIQGFTHICNNANEGVAKGNNMGTENAIKDGCSKILLLNNDIEFYQPLLLANLLSISITNNEHLIIPKIFFFNSKKIWMAGGTLRKYNAVTYHVGEGDADGSKYNKAAHFFMAPTCFMLVDKKVFDTVGLMDEKYFVYYDDTDFIYRAVARGYKIYYEPSLEVYHKVSSSTGGSQSPFSIYYWNRNRIFFIKKNLAYLYQALAFAYILAATPIKMLLYSKVKRAALLKGVKEGFEMQ